jgi:hypothetical protein
MNESDFGDALRVTAGIPIAGADRKGRAKNDEHDEIGGGRVPARI